MSQANIEGALEAAIRTMALPAGVTDPDKFTAWRNNAFATPAVTVPYQEVLFIYADPDNIEFGANFQEVGYMQINLMYPLQTGTGAARARGQLLRTTFARGNTFTLNGETVTINRTPTVSDGFVDGDRWRVVVKIRFHSNQF